jgi:class 3 adenylate cyclase
MIEELRGRDRLKDTFGKFLDPRLVSRLIASGADQAERRSLTIFFSDIKQFTGVSEQLTASTIVHLLNEYFGTVANVIHSHRGIIDRYIGDAVMAFWVPPCSAGDDHARDACRAALAQRRPLGIATGEAVVGTIGSESARSYTVIGDSVNLASRLEGINKVYGTLILISEETYRLAQEDIEAREVDAITVAGKTEPVRVYELMSLAGQLEPPSLRFLCARHLPRVSPRIAAGIGTERRRASKHAFAPCLMMGRRGYSLNGLASCDPPRRGPIGMVSGISRSSPISTIFGGPQPVDLDHDGVQLKQANREHLSNFRQADLMAEFRFREKGLPYDPAFSSASISPYSVAHGMRTDVAILSVSGWLDGAGYMNGAISRYLTKRHNPRHLLLGPWDHGARIDVSPWRRTVEPEFPLLGEVLRFFDTYLKNLETGLGEEAPVHYFSVHAEQWRSAKGWPPVESRKSFFLGPGHCLFDAPSPSGTDSYQVDFTLGTGAQTRYERIGGLDGRNYYADWQGRTAKMLSYTSEALAAAAELAGHGLVELWLSASEPDLALFVYLTELEADGAARYVTEGLLRALHRKERTPPESYCTAWPFRSFSRSDAAPLVPGKVERIRVPLLPVAWQFSAGSCIRLSIAGADNDHCGQVPHGRPPFVKILRGGDNASQLELPMLVNER